MKFYEFFDGSDSRVFSTKSEAIKEARALGKWLDKEAKESDSPNNRDPITVDEIDVGTPNRAKVLRLIKGEGYVENRTEVWREKRAHAKEEAQ